MTRVDHGLTLERAQAVVFRDPERVLVGTYQFILAGRCRQEPSGGP